MSAPASTVSTEKSAGTHLRGVRLVVARAGCLGVMLFSLAIWLWGVPVRYRQLGTVCTAAPCGDQQPTPPSLAQFHAAGMSLGFYAAYTGTIEVLFTSLFLVLAAVIFWRKSDTRVGLLTAVLLATFGVTQTSADALAEAVPALAIPVMLLSLLSYICLALFLYLFPDGRFVPRWGRYVVMAWIPLYVLSVIVLPPEVFAGLLFGYLAVSLAAQVYRYWRVSTPSQRLQTKWVVFGTLIGILGSILLISAAVLLSLDQSPGTLGFFIGNTLVYAFGALIPLSISVAILRSRLWDIDVIINRTLVYGSLTTLLAAIYFGCVIGAQALAQAFTGDRSLPPIAIVASTLLIAALFTPLRRWIQAFIDRRFYRRKYDTARTLAQFSAALRSEVDLTQLNEHLVTVVRETMQPAHISLWLNNTSPDPRQHAQNPLVAHESGNRSRP